MGFDGCMYCSIDVMIYCVVEGSGVVLIGDWVFVFVLYDIFVVLLWVLVWLLVLFDSVLFSYFDWFVLFVLNLLCEVCD